MYIRYYMNKTWLFFLAGFATNSQGHGTQLSVIMCDIAVIHSTYSYCFIELLIISILNV
jgi:hypothetical protein